MLIRMLADAVLRRNRRGARRHGCGDLV